MTDPCRHARTGVVTSLSEVIGKHAEAPVCDRQECIDAAKVWVARVSGKTAHYVLDEVQR